MSPVYYDRGVYGSDFRFEPYEGVCLQVSNLEPTPWLTYRHIHICIHLKLAVSVFRLLLPPIFCLIACGSHQRSLAPFLKVFSRNLTFTIALETSSSRTEKKNERIVSSNCTLYIAKSRSRDKFRILKVSLVFTCTLFRVKCIVIRPQEIIFYSWSSTWKFRFLRAFSLKINTFPLLLYGERLSILHCLLR